MINVLLLTLFVVVFVLNNMLSINKFKLDNAWTICSCTLDGAGLLLYYIQSDIRTLSVDSDT